MPLQTWKVWFRNSDEDPLDQVTFSIDFNVPPQPPDGTEPLDLVWDAAKTLAEKLNISFTRSMDRIN